MKKEVLLLLIVIAYSSGCHSPLLEKKGQHTSYSESLSEAGRWPIMGSYDHIISFRRITAQTGDFSGSFDIHSRLAGSIYDEELLKKTVNFALLSKKYVEAYFLSKKLCKLRKDSECYARFTAIAAKLNLVDEAFLKRANIIPLVKDAPESFLGSISNNLALVDASHHLTYVF